MPFAGEPDPRGPDVVSLAVDYLDWCGSVLLRRLDGLDDLQLRRSVVPSGWSALGLVKHSAATRRYWVRHVFEGDDVDFSWPGSAEQEWEVTPDDTGEHLRSFYRQEHEHSLRVFRGSPPSTVSARDYGGTGVRPTLAWILLHLVQESARHAGHLDISRELTDGRTDFD
ncbi:DUF664 domain-containing protein [Kineococcus sp. R8]|nr:DinB family protein [Kineococcus siccus]NAZ82619.1 DUF664 domain-containing protein [Kineococcus siccus]